MLIQHYIQANYNTILWIIQKIVIFIKKLELFSVKYCK